jgi:hypothetical protein
MNTAITATNSSRPKTHRFISRRRYRKKSDVAVLCSSNKGFYHRGIEVFYGSRKTIKKDTYREWRFADSKDEDTIMVYCVGKLPFDSIDHLDWTRDKPHIYCRFKKGDPFEAKPFYVKFHVHSEMVHEVKHFRPWDKKRAFWFARSGR